MIPVDPNLFPLHTICSQLILAFAHIYNIFYYTGCGLSNLQVSRVHVPYASVGPNEPHAASTACPDGILERQDSDLLYPDRELVTGLAEFLNAELPSHPKLCRGQMKNGLRYLILPNKVPPNRYDLCFKDDHACQKCL